ncbi:Glycine--tRNA ligase beta subunit [Bienertia sinuspersici]
MQLEVPKEQTITSLQQEKSYFCSLSRPINTLFMNLKMGALFQKLVRSSSRFNRYVSLSLHNFSPHHQLI